MNQPAMSAIPSAAPGQSPGRIQWRSNDRYANQSTAYLLQRLEDYAGMVLPATNLHGNLDPALARRLNATVYFPRPGKRERARLWENALAGQFKLPDGWSPDKLAEYDLSGAEIVSIVRCLALTACKSGNFSPEACFLLEELERERPEHGFKKGLA